MQNSVRFCSTRKREPIFSRPSDRKSWFQFHLSYISPFGFNPWLLGILFHLQTCPYLCTTHPRVVVGPDFHSRALFVDIDCSLLLARSRVSLLSNSKAINGLPVCSVGTWHGEVGKDLPIKLCSDMIPRLVVFLGDLEGRWRLSENNGNNKVVIHIFR